MICRQKLNLKWSVINAFNSLSSRKGECRTKIVKNRKQINEKKRRVKFAESVRFRKTNRTNSPNISSLILFAGDLILIFKTSLHLSLRFVPKHRTLACFFLTFERQIISLTHCDIVSYPSKASLSWFKLQLGLKNGLFFSPECLDNWRLVSCVNTSWGTF